MQESWYEAVHYTTFDWVEMPEPKFENHFQLTVPTISQTIPWPHAPRHELSSAGTYFVTAGTLLKKHHFRTRDRLELLHRELLTVAHDFEWQLQAWAVFSNHYHFIGHSPTSTNTAESLSQMLAQLHQKTAKVVNAKDCQSGRQVWHNYWDTKLTYEKSYLARLSYVHRNPVKHGLVPVANLYPWCSAQWFERTARPAEMRMIYSFKTERVRVFDDFDVAADW